MLTHFLNVNTPQYYNDGLSHRFGNAADRKGRRNSLRMHIY